MSHRRKEKLDKKNKNQRDSEQILQQFIREIDNEIDILRHKIKIRRKLRDAIEWSLT